MEHGAAEERSDPTQALQFDLSFTKRHFALACKMPRHSLSLVVIPKSFIAHARSYDYFISFVAIGYYL